MLSRESVKSIHTVRGRQITSNLLGLNPSHSSSVCTSLSLRKRRERKVITVCSLTRFFILCKDSGMKLEIYKKHSGSRTCAELKDEGAGRETGKCFK